MKTISTLVKDIQDRISSSEPFDTTTVTEFGTKLASILANRLSRGTDKPSLRLSNLGAPCERKLWYSINQPERAEKLPPSAKFKFLFGDIIEEVILFLAKAAGHSVKSEQAEVSLHGVPGHIDAVIDGELVDVKSASSYAFNKFKYHTLAEDDAFGYRTQLDSYRVASSGNPDLLVGNRAHFLAVDKTLGHITLDTHTPLGVEYEEVVQRKREMLAWPKPPNRGFTDIPEGASGNRKLGVGCSYCSFKHHCWPNLRTFAYSRGPVFLTVVQKEPNVAEIKGTEEAQASAEEI
mgnify:CR=1 FL=1